MSVSLPLSSGHVRKSAKARKSSRIANDRLRKAVVEIQPLETRMLLSASLVFGSPTTIDLGSHKGQFALAVTDINGDGIPDLIAANADGTVSVAIGNGDGTFQTVQNVSDGLGQGGGTAQSMVVGIVNGATVIAVSRTGSDLVDILQLNGNGTLTSEGANPVGGGSDNTALTIGSIDGDSFLAVGHADGSVSINEFSASDGGNTGGYYGFYTTQNYTGVVTSSPAITSIASGDFVNGGAGTDLVVTGGNGTTGTAELIPGNSGGFDGGSGGFDFGGETAITQAGTTVGTATTATLTSSGFNDVLIATDTGTVIPLLGGNNTSGGSDSNVFVAEMTLNPGLSDSGSGDISVGDFNGDGKQDFIFTQYNSSLYSYQSQIFQGNGDGTFQAPQIGPLNSYTNVASNLHGDGQGDVIGDYYDSLTIAPNQSPLGASFSSPDTADVNVGTPFSFTITTDGFPSPTITESGALPGGLKFHNNGNGTASILGIPTNANKSTYAITLTAKNSSGDAVTQTLTLDVRQAPSITSTNKATFSEGVAGSFTVTTKGGLPSTSISASNLPTGLMITDNGNGTATISGTPTESGLFTDGASDPVIITATSGPFTVTQDLNVTVNQAPVISGGASTTFTTGTPGSFIIDATNGGATVPTPTLSLKGHLPSGVKFKDNGNGTATISGTPSSTSAGVYNITIDARNTKGSAVPETFTLTVDKAPVVTTAASTTFLAGANNAFTIKAGGLPFGAITEVGGLPAGVTLVDNGDGTATLSGTPADDVAGVYHFTISVANTTSNNTTANGTTTADNTVTQSFTLTVSAPPQITSSDTTTFTAGVSNTFDVTTTGYPLAALTASGLPKGLVFTNLGNGTATISGTPTSKEVGSYHVALTAVNASGKFTQKFLLTVAA